MVAKVRDVYRSLKFGVGGFGMLGFAAALVATGGQRNAPAAVGLAAVGALFVALAAALAFGTGGQPVGGAVPQPTEDNTQAVEVWLGVALTVSSGLLYLYLRYALVRDDPKFAGYFCGALLSVGLLCLAKGLWPGARREGKGPAGPAV